MTSFRNRSSNGRIHIHHFGYHRHAWLMAEEREEGFAEILRARPLAQFRNRSFAQYSSMSDHADLVADVFGLGKGVRREEHAFARRRERLDRDFDRVIDDRIEAAGRLVED